MDDFQSILDLVVSSKFPESGSNRTPGRISGTLEDSVGCNTVLRVTVARDSTDARIPFTEEQPDVESRLGQTAMK